MESELTEDPLPAIIITVFILFLHLYYVSTELRSSPINIQEKMIPVPESLHFKMGFLVSANSFHLFGLVTETNYKDIYKLHVLPHANINMMALRQYHQWHLASFITRFPSQTSFLHWSIALSSLPSPTTHPQGTEFTQLYSQSFQTIGMRQFSIFYIFIQIYFIFISFFFQISHWLCLWLTLFFSKTGYHLHLGGKKERKKAPGTEKCSCNLDKAKWEFLD